MADYVRRYEDGSVEMNVRCKPWSEAGVGLYTVMVDLGDHPRARVWDPVGRIYTVCHSLTQRSEARIIRIARACDLPASPEEA